MKLHELILDTVALPSVSLAAAASRDMTINVGSEAVVFRDAGSLQVWAYASDDVWMEVFYLSSADLQDYSEATPDANIVIAAAGDLTADLLDNGQCQVTTGAALDSKIDNVIFKSDFTYASEQHWSVYPDA